MLTYQLRWKIYCNGRFRTHHCREEGRLADLGSDVQPKGAHFRILDRMQMLEISVSDRVLN
jgi:hypothetical protein